MTDKTKKIIFIILVVLILTSTVYYFIKKDKIKKKVEIIGTAIESGAGYLGKDVDSVLVNTIASSGVTKDSDLLLMNSGDEKDIISALSGKTKAQIKKMINDYFSRFKEKFNDHLNDAFDHWYGYDSDAYQSVLSVVNSAK